MTIIEKRLHELQTFYKTGECYVALLNMIFWDKDQYFDGKKFPDGISRYSISTGTIVTFLELIVTKDAFCNDVIFAVFIHDNIFTIVAGGVTGSIETAKERLLQITGLTSS